MTVAEAAAQYCSTFCVAPLSMQVIRETMALDPGILIPVASPHVAPSTTTHLFLQAVARASLMKVLAERPSVTLIVNSCLRDVVSQVVIHRWYVEKRCGITLAAPPGASPHELGVALDIQARAEWERHFEHHGWRWQGTRDKMHFTYAGEHRADVASVGVKAFQVLWNRHNPDRLLAEDGAFGPATEAAVLSSPAGGW